jgi:K+-transporting ATPase KdpF subunit
VVGGRNGLFCRLLGPGAFSRQLASGGLNVDWTTLLALTLAAGLALYLMAALLAPEKFS